MPQKKTPEEFINELREISPDIIPLETYINYSTKIKFRCSKCGNQWLASPAHVLSGEGCPICARKKSADKRRYSKEEFSKKVRLLHPNIEVVGDYINSQTKILVHCTKCDNKWSVVPASLLHGTGCPKCNKRFRRNTEGFIDELKVISPHISVLGHYKNAHEKILVRCNRCGTEWYVEPNSLLKGNDCPNCNHSQTSVIEQILYKSFSLLVGEGKVISRDRTTIGKELDIYVPDLALAVEFGAWYWHSNRLQNDQEKERLCEQAGIRLVTLYEGCPKETVVERLKNAICFTDTISNEKNYETIREFIYTICNDYGLDSSDITNQWKPIVKQAKEESRKKDAEQFARELAIVSPEIEYLGEYSGSKNSVYVKCRKCGAEWLASSAYDLLHGHGCPECAKIQRGVSQRLSPEEFRKRVLEINPDLELLEEYNGPNELVLCRCKKCGTEWMAKPDSILYKRRNCPTCSPVTKKTNEQFLMELSTKTDSIVPLEEYKNSRTPIRFKCITCNYEWTAKPSDIIRGTGCPRCAKRISISHEEFVSRMGKINNQIEIIGEYKDSKSKVKCRCKKCGYEWLATPSNLLKGSGCQSCAGTLRLTDEEFRNRLHTINSKITPLEQYINRSTKILCVCGVCGYKWKASPGNLLGGHGCPKCKAAKARRIREKKIVCIETGQIYDSISAAKAATGITTISDCLKHKTKTAGKLHWAYVEK